MAEPPNLLGRGVAFPPRLGPDGRMAWSDGEDNVRDAIRVILLTRLRERLMRPAFGGGLQDFLFQPNTLATRRLLEERARKALARWEPRIRVEGIAAEPSADDPQQVLLLITYRIVATGGREQTTLNIQFAQ